MKRLRQLIHEVHRRSLWQVLGIYVVASWAVLEAVEGISATAGLPEWLAPFALVLLLIGLPIVMATAFVQEGIGSSASDSPIPQAGDPSSSTAAAPREVTEPPVVVHRLLTWRNALGGGVAAFALWGVIATWVMTTDMWPGNAPPVAAGAQEPTAASVAVLPFDDIGGQDEAAYISQGITEEITAQLARLPDLHVISRTSAEAVSGYSLTIPQIADTLGVEHVVEGSVQVVGDQLRVTAQLIHAATDNHLWADSYNGSLADVFTLQEDIAVRVAAALSSAVTGSVAPSPRPRTAEPAAYEAYLIGKSRLHSRSADAMLAAIEAFERSVAQDPNYAPAYAGLAGAYGLSVTYGHPDLDGYELYRRGIAMANRAIELDESAAEAYAARGYLRTKGYIDASAIDRDFERALQLSPNSADAHGWYANFLSREDRHDEALAEATIAIDIDPVAPGRRNGFAMDALAARRYDLAVREAQRSLALAPTLGLPRFVQGVASLLGGRPGDCLDTLGDSYPGLRAMCMYARGDEVEALELVGSLRAGLSGGNEPTNHAEMILYRDIATFYAWTGDADEALSWLDRAFTWSHNALEFRVLASGVFDSVRESPDFDRRLDAILERARERLSG